MLTKAEEEYIGGLDIKDADLERQMEQLKDKLETRCGRVSELYAKHSRTLTNVSVIGRRVIAPGHEQRQCGQEGRRHSCSP